MSQHKCVVCRNEACGSNEERSCSHCTNCGVPSASRLCQHCEKNRKCITCHRHLPAYCFSIDATQCQACSKRPQHRVSVSNIVNEVTIPTDRGTESFDAFVSRNGSVIDDIVDDYRRRYGSIRVQIRTDNIFVRDAENGQQRIPAYFATHIYDVDPSQDLDLQSVAADLSAQADNWNARGSGFTLDRITKFVICISKYRPLQGSSYVDTPEWLKKKRAVVNVKNTTDSKFFVWSILSALRPPKYNAERVYNYRPQENTFNLSGLTFPMPVKDIPKFEKQNSDISVNAVSYTHLTLPTKRIV